MRGLLPIAFFAAACGAPQPPNPEPQPTAPVAPAPTPTQSTEAKAEGPPSAPSAAASSSAGGAREVPFDMSAAKPIAVAPAPFEAALKSPVPIVNREPPPRLVRIFDEDRNKEIPVVNPSAPWIGVPNPFVGSAFGPSEPEPGELPPGVPATWNGLHAVRAFDRGGGALILVFGKNFGSGRYVAVFDSKKRLTSLLDFEAYRVPPTVLQDLPEIANECVQWADERDGVVYVQTSHPTYAATTKGKNAYITAVDAATGAMFWRSAPLVANQDTFAIRGSYIISGYAFTGEPKNLFVLDRSTGKIVSRLPVEKFPRVIMTRDDKVVVGSINPGIGQGMWGKSTPFRVTYVYVDTSKK